MDLGIKDRVAFVTGSSQGIGRCIADLLASEGARVAITYRHEELPAVELANQISERGGQAMVVKYDLESAESIRDAVHQVVEKWDKIDILVNNAVCLGSRSGTQSPMFENWPVNEWQLLVRANLEGAFITTQHAVFHMRRQRWGCIVNMSSNLAEDGQPGRSWYCTAKAGINGFTKSLFKELGPFGILINSVLPAPTRTRRLDSLSLPIKRHLERTVALDRMLDPCEVARIVTFLCSEANAVITGETIRLGGGRL